MKPVILMRTTLAEEAECEVAKRYFDVKTQRCHLGISTPGYEPKLVIGRYSVLPYYEETEYDISAMGNELINSFRQHRYVADISNWYHDFESLTPKTWFRLEDVPQDQPGSFVLKGATNSRKSLWKTHMFAATRDDVIDVYFRLSDDTMIGQQGIYIRQFEEFVSFGEGLNGAPITKEFRFFILDGEIVGAGFYWSEHFDELRETHPGQVLNPPIQWVRDNVCEQIKDKIRFVVVDVAQRVDGEWRIVEFNDGQMSGLSCIDVDVLYSNLAAKLA